MKNSYLFTKTLEKNNRKNGNNKINYLLNVKIPNTSLGPKKTTLNE